MFVSTKNYSPGDIITSTEPLIYLLHANLRGKLCDTCFCFPAQLYGCSGCHLVFYCSKDCQTKDWLAHHKYFECKVFKAGAGRLRNLFTYPHDSNCDSYIFIIRVYLTLRGRPDLKTKIFHLVDGSKRCFNDLMSLKDNVTKLQSRAKCINEMGSVLKMVLLDFNPEEFLDIYGKVAANRYLMMDYQGHAMGYAISVVLSKLNHSCRPNASSVSKRFKQEIRATTDIAVGQEVTVSYLHFRLLLVSREDRRSWLKYHYSFHCKCIRCKRCKKHSVEDDKNCKKLQDFQGEVNKKMMKEIKRSLVRASQALDLFHLSLKMLPLERKTFGQFNENTTELLHSLLSYRCQAEKFFKDYKSFTYYLKESERAFEVTYGQDHPEFQFFMMVKQRYGL